MSFQDYKMARNIIVNNSNKLHVSETNLLLKASKNR